MTDAISKQIGSAIVIIFVLEICIVMLLNEMSFLHLSHNKADI